LAVAVTFVWLGMVLAISFLEAPLKFRAPNVTRQIGLGIGRLMFRALNSIEVVFAIIVVAISMVSPPPAGVIVALATACTVLAAQLLAVRPFLNRRSDRALAGLNAPQLSRPLRVRRSGSDQGHRIGDRRDYSARHPLIG
jgi:hypothetical protein